MTGSYCDMTYFEDKNGQSYYLSAGFALAKFDPETPWKLSAASTADTENYAVLPDKGFAWEAGGAYEGQYVIEHEGRYYITYSAPSCRWTLYTGVPERRCRFRFNGSRFLDEE